VQRVGQDNDKIWLELQKASLDKKPGATGLGIPELRCVPGMNVSSD